MIVGSMPTAVGCVTVNGTGGLPIVIPPSTLDLTGSGKVVTVGDAGGILRLEKQLKRLANTFDW